MKIKCPGCSAVLSIPESAAGKVVKCPCGKQLRAPGGSPAPAAKPGAAKPPAAKPGAAAARPAQGRPVAARRPPAAAPDAGLFDELTDRDMNPYAAASDEAASGPKASSPSGKLLQQYSSGGSSGRPKFRVGPRASPWTRFAAAILDGLVIGLLAAPVLVGCMILLVPMMVDLSVLENADQMDQAQREALAASLTPKIAVAYSISVALGYLLPIVVYAVMITKSGQTPGKKVCGIRILDSQTRRLPGFAKGVLARSWLFNLLYAIPMLGAIIWLVDACMIFGSDRTCLHDRVAGTMVVES